MIFSWQVKLFGLSLLLLVHAVAYWLGGFEAVFITLWLTWLSSVWFALLAHIDRESRIYHRFIQSEHWPFE